MLVAFVGGFCASRINANESGAVAFGLHGNAPKVQVAGDGVAAPNHNQFGMNKIAGAHAHRRTHGVQQPLGTRRCTNGTVQQRCAQTMKKPSSHAVALHLAHGASVAVGQYRLRIALRNGLQPCGDGVQSFFPTDGFKTPLALGTHTLHGVQQTVGVVDAFGVTRHLGAQHAIGGGMIWVAMDCRDLTIHHRAHQGACVGAVVWTRPQYVPRKSSVFKRCMGGSVHGFWIVGWKALTTPMRMGASVTLNESV